MYDPLLFAGRGRIEVVALRGDEPEFRSAQVPRMARPDCLLLTHAPVPLCGLPSLSALNRPAAVIGNFKSFRNGRPYSKCGEWLKSALPDNAEISAYSFAGIYARFMQLSLNKRAKRGDNMFTVSAEIIRTSTGGRADAAAVQFDAHPVKRRLVAKAFAAQALALNGSVRDRATAIKFPATLKALVVCARADYSFCQ